MKLNIIRSYYDKETHNMKEEKVKELSDEDLKVHKDPFKAAKDYINETNEPLYFYFDGDISTAFPGRYENSLYADELRKLLEAENKN